MDTFLSKTVEHAAAIIVVSLLFVCIKPLRSAVALGIAYRWTGFIALLVRNVSGDWEGAIYIDGKPHEVSATIRQVVCWCRGTMTNCVTGESWFLKGVVVQNVFFGTYYALDRHLLAVGRFRFTINNSGSELGGQVDPVVGGNIAASSITCAWWRTRISAMDRPQLNGQSHSLKPRLAGK